MLLFRNRVLCQMTDKISAICYFIIDEEKLQ